MNILIIFLFFALAVLPSFLAYIIEKRNRKLAEQELQISLAVLEMESILHDAVITSGSVCHDLIYKIMCKIQKDRDYGFRFSSKAFEELSDSQKEIISNFERELNSSNPRLNETLDKFASAYFLAAFYKRPVQFLTSLILMLFSLKLQTFALRRMIEFTLVKRKLRDLYVSRSISENAKLA